MAPGVRLCPARDGRRERGQVAEGADHRVVDVPGVHHEAHDVCARYPHWKEVGEWRREIGKLVESIIVVKNGGRGRVGQRGREGGREGGRREGGKEEGREGGREGGKEEGKD